MNSNKHFKYLAFINNEEQLGLLKRNSPMDLKEILFITNIDMEPIFVKHNLVFKNLWDYTEFEELKDIEKIANSYTLSLHNLIKNDLVYEDTNLIDIAETSIEAFFVQAVTYLIILRKVLQIENPKIVIFQRDYKKMFRLSSHFEDEKHNTLEAILAFEVYKKNIFCFTFSCGRLRNTVYKLCFWLAKARMIKVSNYLCLYFEDRLRTVWQIYCFLKNIFTKKTKIKFRFKNQDKQEFINMLMLKKDKARVIFLGWDIDFLNHCQLIKTYRKFTDKFNFISICGGLSEKFKQNINLDEFDSLYLTDYEWINRLEEKVWMKFQKRIWKLFSRYILQNILQRISSDYFYEILCNPLLKKQFKTFLTLSNFYEEKNMANFILNTFSPRIIIISGTQSLFAKILRKIINEKKLNTKIIVIPHGGYICYKDSLFLKSYNYNRADIVTTWGEIMNQIFAAAGVDSSKLIITGNYLYDNYLDRRKYYQPSINRISAGTKKILVLTGSSQGMIDPYFNEDAHRNTLLYLTQLPQHFLNFKVSFKPHPRYDYYNFIKYICSENNVGCEYISAEVPLEQIILNFDLFLVVNCYTSAVIEPLFYFKPVICINTAISPYYQPEYAIVKLNGIPCLYKNEDIIPAIQKVFNDRNFKEELINTGQEFLKKYVDNFNGNATYRILDLLNKVTGALDR